MREWIEGEIGLFGPHSLEKQDLRVLEINRNLKEKGFYVAVTVVILPEDSVDGVIKKIRASLKEVQEFKEEQ